VASSKISSSRSSHASTCSSHGSVDNYHIGARNFVSSEEDRIPCKKTRFKRIRAHKSIKQALSKAARRKKEQAYIANTSDEDDKFAGGE